MGKPGQAVLDEETVKKEEGGMQLTQRNVTEYTFTAVGKYSGLQYSFKILAETQHEAIEKIKKDMEYFVANIYSLENSSGS